jgi:plasmid stabilization system protein ParE
MAAIIRFLRLARKELDAANRRYVRQDPRRAQRFADAVSHAPRQIADNPYLWPVYQDPFRWIQAGRFPYILYYRLFDPDVVLIYAVAHASRRPGYWRRLWPP